METLTIVLAAVALTMVLVLLRDRSRSPAPGEDAGVGGLKEELRLMRAHMENDARIVHSRLEGLDTRVLDSQSRSLEVTESIATALGALRNATDTVADQAREFTALQDLLRAPKARGGIGEAMLEELLRQVLPPSAYSMQHRFKTGVIVDAAVQAGGKIVCIDSKFPLANHTRMCDATDDVERMDAERAFAQDVDKHVKDIAVRYILPDEGTFDFAVMYVPAEGVYGEVLRLKHRKRPLFEAAMDRRVVPMSPLTMYGYLQTILFGLKCLRIEEGAAQILDHCGRLQGDLARFAEEYDTLGNHLHNARSRYEKGAGRLDTLRGKLERMAELGDAGDEDEDGPRLEAVAE